MEGDMKRGGRRQLRLLPAVTSPELPTEEGDGYASCWPIETQIKIHMRPSKDTVVLVV
jgi:hypothetical protein